MAEIRSKDADSVFLDVELVKELLWSLDRALSPGGRAAAFLFRVHE